MPADSDIDLLAQKIWDYHHLNHTLVPSDAVLVLGSHDLRVAERGAQLYLEGWAPLLIFSGGRGRLTPSHWKTTEAEEFAAVAFKLGVPATHVLIENLSTNTSENIQFTKALLARRGLGPQKFILVQKPYMQRRGFATFKKVWPEKDVIVAAPQIGYRDYPNAEISKEDIIEILVGDLQRIRLYGEKGFQVPQEIPPDVWEAFEKLTAAGYTKQLIKG